MTLSHSRAPERASDAPVAHATTGPHVATFLDGYAAHVPGIEGSTEPIVDLTSAADRMQVSDVPFVYGTIDDFLPPDLYRAVLADWPTSGALAAVTLPPTGDAKSNYLGSRKARLLDEWRADCAKPAEEATWRRVARALQAPGFVRALFTRFNATVDENLSTLVEQPSEAGFRLYACYDQGAAEALGAHLDAMRKVLTIVVYLGLEGETNAESADVWGTALYDGAPQEVTPLQFMPNADYRPARRVAFAPNRAFVMPNSRRAFHGVAGGQAGVARKTLMCGYWYFAK